MFQHAGSNGEVAATANAAANASEGVAGDRGGGPVVAADSVRVRFGALEAVRGVSFTLRPGDLLGLIGPNGAGKTTLIDVISGKVKPTDGRVIFGHDIDLAGTKLLIAEMAPQRSLREVHGRRHSARWRAGLPLPP